MKHSITVNGKTQPLAGPVTLNELLATLDLAGTPVVVELDGLAILPRNHPTTTVHPGSHLEIVTLAAGG